MYVCRCILHRDMETQLNSEKRENRGLYWLITLVSLVACIALIVVSPEWFWLTLPFLFTFLVKALDMM